MSNIESIRMSQIFNAKRPKSFQKAPADPVARVIGYNRFNTVLESTRESNSAIEADVTKLTEGVEAIVVNETVSKEQVRAWLDRAQSVISERSDQIHSNEEKEKFLALSNTIKNFTPVAEASDEDVLRSLSNLKQNIKIEEKDSDHLVSVKRHLTAELDKMIS